MCGARWVLLLAPMMLASAGASIAGQASAAASQQQLNASGYVTSPGRKVPYLVRRLPIDSFPDIPAAIQAEFTRRGCLIPQTYEAHRPENVIHGSFERPGSSDWAALCSANGVVSLLVFFASAPRAPFTLVSAQETARLQAHDPTGVMGFNWAIDVETPAQVHDAQVGMEPRPAKLDHDAVGDLLIDGKTIYRYYTRGGWTVVDTGE